MRIQFIQNFINIFKKKYTNEKRIIRGENNKIVKNPKLDIGIQIFGNNNQILIDEDITYFCANIYIGTFDCYVNNCLVSIGKNSMAHGVEIRLLEDDSTVEIGEDCLFSSNINIDCSDTHAIFDCNSLELLNVGKSVKIGNHVWIGKNVTVCKNTEISDNSVVGTGSIVTKKFSKPNSIIAGIPADIKKENINWSTLRPKQYLESLNK